MIQNPWHEISVGKDAPEVVQVLVEIPHGARTKYELDKETGLIRLDRILTSAVHYPANYGFIPRTYCEDGDPLDILVLCAFPLLPMSLVDARVIGVMEMIDDGERDDKIIAVAHHDIFYTHVRKLEDLSPHITNEIKIFFEDYKKNEHKKVTVKSFSGREEALKTIEESIEFYNQKFLKEKS